MYIKSIKRHSFPTLTLCAKFKPTTKKNSSGLDKVTITTELNKRPFSFLLETNLLAFSIKHLVDHAFASHTFACSTFLC